MRKPITDKSPNYAINSKIKHFRPIPSECSNLDEKLDQFKELISLPNSLYVAINEFYQKFTYGHDENEIFAAQVTHFDLMVIAQMLNEKIENEFNQLAKFLTAQGGKDE